jgi:hypothetical protein
MPFRAAAVDAGPARIAVVDPGMADDYLEKGSALKTMGRSAPRRGEIAPMGISSTLSAWSRI